MLETDFRTGHRIVLGGLALLFGGSGLWMLAAPGSWYAATPGVEHTGPLNVHFIRDIGGIYLAMAAAQWLALRDWHRGRSALLVSLAWLTVHALVHASLARPSDHSRRDVTRSGS